MAMTNQPQRNAVSSVHFTLTCYKNLSHESYHQKYSLRLFLFISLSGAQEDRYFVLAS